jgi:hypothetical protein
MMPLCSTAPDKIPMTRRYIDLVPALALVAVVLLILFACVGCKTPTSQPRPAMPAVTPGP